MAFAIAEAGAVSLTVHDLRGRRVATLADEERDAGRHQATWDGRDADGRGLPPGIYYLRLAAGGMVAARRVLLLD
jgi:flagellar hook assembly protein FlgD